MPGISAVKIGIPLSKKSGINWSAYWTTLWNGIGGDVAIERQGSDYFIHQQIASGLFWSLRLKSTTTGANTINSILGSAIRKPALRIDQSNVGITYGGTWVGTALANASSFGGTYARADVAAAYAEYTTGAGATSIGMRTQFFTNSGMILVTIDDDNTLANLVTTAQELVTAGTLPDTVLVANGGTLNPTDRVLDSYNSNLFSTTGNEINTGYYKLLANGLTAGAHKIRLTTTGYKNAASGGVRLILDCFYYNTVSITGANWSTIDTDLLPVTSVFEYAHTVQVGAGSSDFVGNTHGYDNQTSLTLNMDGVAVTPADQEVVVGSLIEIVRESSLKDIDAGTEIGTSVTTYTLHPTNGLTIGWEITWGVELTAGTACYAAMFPMAGLLDRGANNAYATDVDLSPNDGTYKARANGRYAYLWDTNGVYGARFEVSDIDTAIDGLVSADGHLWIEDRNEASAFNKIYLLRNSGAVAIGEKWECEANYRVKQFADANASLANIGIKP